MFPIFKSQFESYVSGAPTSTFHGAALDRRIGIFHVDEYAADPRGGVYFRTGSTGDGMGPDLMSYGFAFQPNNQGTPFGAAPYGVWPLGGGWDWFRASDDY